jgi:hypothetical protein
MICFEEDGGSQNSPFGVESYWMHSCSMIVGVEVESKKVKKYEDELGLKIIQLSFLATVLESLLVFLTITNKSASIQIPF